MPAVATYYQLVDKEVTLAVGAKREFTQPVGVTPAGGEGALVTWVARRVAPAAGTLDYTVTLNAHLLGTYTLTSAAPVAIQEATDTSHVIKGTNKLVFEVKPGGTGDLHFSAVMLWHRV